MILIDRPFVSDFLIQTIKENNFEIVSTKEAKSMITDESLNWISEGEAKQKFLKSNQPRIYTNSENALAWIFDNLSETKLPKQIELFKDKFKFRELIQSSFPDYLFRKIGIDDIQTIDIDSLKLPFVIKPTLGFFSIGVQVIHSKEDWYIAQKELRVENLKSIYPKAVMDASSFIIEDYIEGEEFAVDAYFNDEGKAVVLSILQHMFSSSSDVSDRLYFTSKSIINRYIPSIEEFLNLIGLKAELKNFPLHLELRIDSEGIIRPIEINPQRFGGWCTTADLSFHAFQFNSYQYFIQNKKPDWETIFNQKEDEIHSIILLNNNSGIEASDINSFDFEALQKDLEHILEIRALDFKKYPAFGIVFAETQKENADELRAILTSDLRKYIKT